MTAREALAVIRDEVPEDVVFERRPAFAENVVPVVVRPARGDRR
jgi:hypothetical protein